MYEKFYEHVKKCAEEFKKIDRQENIKVVSHIDADGISSCALMLKLLNNEGRRYSVSNVQSLDKEVIESIANSSNKYVVFTDLGSGVLSHIKEHLSDKKVFILDHHSVEENVNYGDVVFVNPHIFGIDGGKEICGAGVVFRFVREIDPSMDEYSHVAVVGAIGDMQENNGFERLNKDILDIAIAKGKVEVKKGLRIFGSQTRPIHKALEYCTDPLIPGVSGSESGAIQFLNELGINPKNGSGWKKLVNLDDDEMKRLVGGVIMKRFGQTNPEDVLGNTYTLLDEKEESPTRDAKEFATLLNACGRLNRASVGVGACIGDSKLKKQAINSLSDYKKEIVNALKWYEENKFNDDVHFGDQFVIINAKDKVMSTIIGTMASILSKSNLMKENKFILSMAYAEKECIKVSLRSSMVLEGSLDLKEMIHEIVKDIDGCEAGGHQNAAGAVLPNVSESIFIESAKEVLSKYAMEENVG